MRDDGVECGYFCRANGSEIVQNRLLAKPFGASAIAPQRAHFLLLRHM